MALLLLPSATVARCRFLASASRLLRSYVTFSAALFLDFSVLRLIHLACSFATIASTPLLHLVVVVVHIYKYVVVVTISLFPLFLQLPSSRSFYKMFLILRRQKCKKLRFEFCGIQIHLILIF